MSKQMRMLLIGLVVLLVLLVALTKFGPLNPPLLGPLLKGEEVTELPDTSGDFGAADGGLGSDCPPGQIPGTATDTGAVDPAATDPLATDPAATDPAATDPAATDPGAGLDGATTGAPAEGAPSGGEGRILAAGPTGYAAGTVTDTPIYAAEAPVDPAAGAEGAGTDSTLPGTGTGLDDSTTLDPMGTSPDAATGTGTTGCVPDPDAGAVPGAGTGDPLTTDPDAGTGGTGTGTGTPDAGTGTGTPGGSPAAAGSTTTDGTNDGNSPEALRIAKDASTVMQQAKISVAVQATLLPAVGGTGPPKAVRAYRRTVTAAVLVIKLNDANAQSQWTSAGKRVQVQLVRSFLQRLRKNYPRSSRSVTVIDSSGKLLAVGDATAARATGAVKLF